MTVELALAIVVGASYCCYLVWQWQGAAIPPYQEPIKCNGDCNQGRTCDCYTRSTEKAELDTPLNPKAAWPFPSGDKP